MMPVSKRSNYFYRFRVTPARFCVNSFPVFLPSTFHPQKMAGYPHITSDFHRFMHSSSTGSVDNSGNAVPPSGPRRHARATPWFRLTPALQGCRIRRFRAIAACFVSRETPQGLSARFSPASTARLIALTTTMWHRRGQSNSNVTSSWLRMASKCPITSAGRRANHRFP